MGQERQRVVFKKALDALKRKWVGLKARRCVCNGVFIK